MLVAGVLILTGVIDLVSLFAPNLEEACRGNECGGGAGVWAAGGTLTVLGIVFTGMGWFFKRADSNYKRIMTTGIRGVATINKIGPSHVYVNKQPMAHLDLTIETGTKRYEINHSAVVPLVYLATLMPGTRIPVVVDPRDKTGIILQWADARVPQAVAPN